MKIQWLLIASLLLISLVGEAFDGSSAPPPIEGVSFDGAAPAAAESSGGSPILCSGTEGAQLAAAELSEKALSHGCYRGLISKAGSAASNSYLSASADACLNKAKGAKSGCLACINSGMQKTIATVSTLLAVGTTVLPIVDACSKFNDALKIGQAGLAAYNAYCGLSQQSCSSSCTKFNGDVEKAKAEVTAAGAEVGLDPSEAVKIAKDKVCLDILKATVSQVNNSCAGYKANMTAAAANLAGILATSIVNKEKCEKQVTNTDCTSNPTSAACATKALDCSLAENASNTTCICQKAPNTPGCAGYVSSNGNTMNMSSDGTDKADIGNTALNAPNSTAGTDVTPVSPTSGGNGVAPSGGGGGTGGLSGGGADGKSKQEKAKGLNPNILSGYDGGSGGGYRGGSGSGRNSELQAYLPNGAKDPARNPAAQLFGGGQVTSAGAKSNFEKINERYSETMPGK